jgi:hypothetical protein
MFLTNVYRQTIEHYFSKVKSLLPNNTFKDRKTNLMRYFYWWTLSFYSSDNPDGIWLLGCNKRLLVNQTNKLQCTTFFSKVINTIGLC